MRNLETLLFDVKKVETESVFGIPANSDYSHAIIGNINGIDTILNVCSDRYELVRNEEIFPVIRGILNDSGMKFTESYSMVNNARFYADYVIENESTFIGTKNDIVKPLIRVRHSYNGLTKYAITFGYFRLICSNGLVIPVEGKEATNLHIAGRHTTAIRTSLDLLMEKLQYFVVNQNVLSNNFNTLSDQWVKDPKDRITEVLEYSGITDRAIETVFNSVQNEATQLYNGNINDWLIYNGVNQFIHNGDNKKVLEQKEIYDHKAIKFLLQAV